jgi:4-hydroxy-4-methyl-2-oxoglutarate aldolase
MNVDRFREFDPATLYEAAGRTGMVDPAIRPAWAGAKVCGIAATLECPPGDNLMLHLAVAAATPGIVLVCNSGGFMRAGAWGEILTIAAQAKGVAGLVIDGCVRDIEAITPLKFPIFSRGLAIGACTKERFGPMSLPTVFGGVNVRPGDIIFGDTDGLVVVERERADEVYAAACKRRDFEAVLIKELRAGKTTVELLNLPTQPATAKK